MNKSAEAESNVSEARGDIDIARAVVAHCLECTEALHIRLEHYATMIPPPPDDTCDAFNAAWIAWLRSAMAVYFLFTDTQGKDECEKLSPFKQPPP